MLGAPTAIGEGLMLATGVFWCIIFIGHALRVLRHPEVLFSDLKHPIRSAFAGGLSIGLMIIAGGFAPYATDLAAVIWGVAVVIHLTIGAYIVRSLLVSPREAATLTPPLLLPLVGNVLAPVIGAKLGFITVSWMLFGLGALLWVIVQPLILYRISTGPILPVKMWPTLVILLAPPAVGSLALALLTDGFGPGPLAIYGYAVLVAAVMLLMVSRFRSIPFAMSWWGLYLPECGLCHRQHEGGPCASVPADGDGALVACCLCLGRRDAGLCCNAQGLLRRPSVPAGVKAGMKKGAVLAAGAPFTILKSGDQVLKRKWMTSPSWTTYSLPSSRPLPASLAPTSPL